MHMIADADATAEADAITDDDAAGNPNHAAQNTAFPDRDVVTDMHMIVDFGAAADAGQFQRGPIDGAACADLNVVANNHVAERMNSGHRDAGSEGGRRDQIRREAEAVSANHRVGVHNDAVAQAAGISDTRPGMKQAAVADRDIGPDRHLGHDRRIPADTAPRAYHRIGAHTNALPQHGVCGNESGWMNPLFVKRPGVKQGSKLGQGQARLVDGDNGWKGTGRHCLLGRHDDRSRFAAQQRSRSLPAHRNGEVGRLFCPRRVYQAFDIDFTVAIEVPRKGLGNILGQHEFILDSI